ncbi:MAG: nuclear transport factor 2 family protein [Bacteroidota bacterium]
MKKTSLTLLVMLFAIVTGCRSQKNIANMEDKIKSVIETFAKAGAENNATPYDHILHSEFRVIANRYPTPDKTSIIPREAYVGLIASKKIGGTPYEVSFQNISIIDHSATVMAHFKGKEGSQWLTFLLVLDASDNWKIITDIAVQKK